MDQLPGLWSLTPFGAIVGMLVTFFLLLSRGKLYTKSQHDEIVALHKQRGDEQKETADEWKSVAQESTAQLGLIAPELKIVGDFFRKVPVTHDDRVSPEGI